MSTKSPLGDSHTNNAYPHTTTSTNKRSIELKKDVTIVVLGASGDLAKKKTVPLPQFKDN
jgi:hypothetical protein